jgi:hypothetical protein
MPDIDAYVYGSTKADSAYGIDAAARAVDAWRRIQDKPTSITVLRTSGDLDPQTVRLELPTSSQDQLGQGGRTAGRSAVVLGVKNHPDSDVADTDIQKGDRFLVAAEGAEYKVLDIVFYAGQVQAFAERTV